MSRAERTTGRENADVSDDRTQIRVPHGDRWEVASAAGGGPVWVSVPTVDELGPVALAHGVSAQAVELLRRHELRHEPERGHRLRAHVERSADGEIVVSVPTLSYVVDSRDVHTGMLVCVLGRDVILTSEIGAAAVLPAAAETLCSGLPVPDEGVRQVLAAIILTLVSRASDVEAELGDAVADTEALVFAEQRGKADPLEQIYALKREIAEARRALNPLTTVLPALQAETREAADAQHASRRTDLWLHRVQASADRLDQHLDAHDSLLDAMLSVHLTQVSVRQNEDMRKISAWAAMGAVPTLIAGIYGMNFAHMPELAWTFGYPLVLGVIAGLCVVLHRAFRRSGWL